VASLVGHPVAIVVHSSVAKLRTEITPAALVDRPVVVVIDSISAELPAVDVAASPESLIGATHARPLRPT